MWSRVVWNTVLDVLEEYPFLLHYRLPEDGILMFLPNVGICTKLYGVTLQTTSIVLYLCLSWGKSHVPDVTGWNPSNISVVLTSCRLSCILTFNQPTNQPTKELTEDGDLRCGAGRRPSVCVAIPALTASLGSITDTLDCAYVNDFPSRLKTPTWANWGPRGSRP